MTDELFMHFGFKKETSVGGSSRWYHKNYYYIHSPNPTFAYISDRGVLSLNYKSENNPKTLREMIDFMTDLTAKNNFFLGQKNITSALKAILEIE